MTSTFPQPLSSLPSLRPALQPRGTAPLPVAAPASPHPATPGSSPGQIDLALGGGREHFLPEALTDAEATDPDDLQQALIPMSSETHSGEDVAIYARGPWSHLVGGTMEQNVIFHVMLAAMNGGTAAILSFRSS